MIWAVLILGFFAFSVGVFFVSCWWVLLGIFVAQILLIVVLRINVCRAVRSVLMFLPFIGLAFGLNLIFGTLENSLLMAARLGLMCNMTFVFMSAVPMLGFVRGLRVFCGRRVAVTVAVAIAFVPLLRDEYRKIKDAMNARGKRRGFLGFGALGLTFQIVMYKVLYRAGNLAQTLDAKGFG